MVGDNVDLGLHRAIRGRAWNGVASIRTRSTAHGRRPGRLFSSISAVPKRQRMAVEMLDDERRGRVVVRCPDCRRRGDGRHGGVQRFDIGDCPAHSRGASRDEGRGHERRDCSEQRRRRELTTRWVLHARPSSSSHSFEAFDCALRSPIWPTGPCGRRKEPGEGYAREGAARRSFMCARPARAAVLPRRRSWVWCATRFGEAMDQQPADQGHG